MLADPPAINDAINLTWSDDAYGTCGRSVRCLTTPGVSPQFCYELALSCRMEAVWEVDGSWFSQVRGFS